MTALRLLLLVTVTLVAWALNRQLHHRFTLVFVIALAVGSLVYVVHEALEIWEEGL